MSDRDELIEQAALAQPVPQDTEERPEDTVRRFARRIQAALDLHRPERRWHDGSGEWSVDTAEEVGVDDPEFFEICTHCGDLEVNDQAPQVLYRDSMWPCATFRALAGEVEGDGR